MRHRLSRTTIALFLVLLPITSLQLNSVSGQASTGNFLRTPPSYNPQTGAFTLGEQAYLLSYGKLCLAYDFFVFNGKGGQAIHWALNSPGQVIYYLIIDARTYGFLDADAQNCFLNISAPLQYFNGQTTLTWTPPQNGQYALVFFTTVYYTGPIYLTQ